uniref:G-protein coupled receptors family 1 profile domain-containing protein n=1 Tax=Calidris pygmaea TaxID=425635 RepID=A0A8C3JEC1_9CHAR
MENQTSGTDFFLLGFTRDPLLQSLLFSVFLIIYLVILLGNTIIMMVIRTHLNLHSPMYFFLFHLALVDICYATATDSPVKAGLPRAHNSGLHSDGS